MKRIYKYQLAIQNSQEIEIHEDAEILTIKMQYDMPVLYAVVDVDKPIVSKQIICRGTGFNHGDNLLYIDTVLTTDESLVWHFFQ